ncbi:MAG: hypothetical protein WB493_02400 [Anaeromyxobacteraceae bacterium]
MRPSRPRGRGEAGLRSLTGTRYHECKECGFRLRLPRGDREAARPGVDWGFWAATALIGAGFAYVYLRVG